MYLVNLNIFLQLSVILGRFEVMLLGKLQLNSDMASQPTFIDEVVAKYHSLELKHAAKVEEFELIKSSVNSQLIISSLRCN